MHDVEPALLTIAWATAAGLLAQLVGHRWRIPAIVPLLIVGVALGPSGLGVVRPAALGDGLSVIVKLAVAVILFDGALNLRLADLRRAIGDVRALVTVGVVITWVGATLAAWWIAGLSVPVAIVFGALVTVTGPTVVQPLLRRVPLPRQVRTVLEGEAILIDPIGAVLAVAVVDVVLGAAGVRPVSALAALRRSTLSWREKAFVAYLAPRGIVAASVASLFALELTKAGFPEGQRGRRTRR